MSQHDYVIDNQSAPNFRTDLNNALAAIATTNSGTSAPSPTYANQLWVDTTNDQLKIRNEDNDAWIVLADLDQTGDKSAPPDASITFAKLAAAAVRASSEGLTGGTDIELPTAAWVEARTLVKAWVVFDGTTGSILGSGFFNVASVVRNATGDYTVNFATPAPNTNYAVFAQSGALTDTSSVLGIPVTARTVNACQILLRNDGGIARDSTYVAVSVMY